METQPVYEVELVKADAPDTYLSGVLATLTGLSLEEVQEYLTRRGLMKGKWGGQTFVRVARDLGYSTAPRFIPFDVATYYPCILRCRIPSNWGKGWWALVYANGQVLNPHFASDWDTLSLADFITRFRQVRITSMLPIWMETTTSLRT